MRLKLRQAARQHTCKIIRSYINVHTTLTVRPNWQKHKTRRRKTTASRGKKGVLAHNIVTAVWRVNHEHASTTIILRVNGCPRPRGHANAVPNHDARGREGVRLVKACVHVCRSMYLRREPREKPELAQRTPPPPGIHLPTQQPLLKTVVIGDVGWGGGALVSTPGTIKRVFF